MSDERCSADTSGDLKPVAFRYMTTNGRWAFLNQSWEPDDPHIYDHLQPLYAAPQPADSRPMAECWHGGRKVTVYPDEVIRVWGTDLDNEMSSEPNRMETVQAAFDWLYAAPQPADSAPAPGDLASRGAVAQSLFDEDYQNTNSFELADIMLKHWDVRWKAGASAGDAQTAVTEAYDTLWEIVRQAKLALAEPIIINRFDTLQKIIAAGEAALAAPALPQAPAND